MSGDPEKRFQKVMDRLYYAPKPKPSLHSGDGMGSLAKGKRAEPVVRGALEKGSRLPASLRLPSAGPTPPCRPWDRGDLMRRLATFKAMTWFAKPEVVGPLNCATRGWINVEMDVIACEACGARLLFSTPSSWPLQQVEKAAAVFSLKLDNGHKLLCPWIDNACDESLALFPPTPPATLIQGYKERSLELIRLTGLPVISSLALDYMKNPQLKHFLSQTFVPSITLNNDMKLIDDSRSKNLEGYSETVTAKAYYQTLKVISLCGWEPRMLPYIVDREDQPTLLPKGDFSTEASARAPGQNKDSIILYPSSGPSDSEGVKNVDSSLGGYQYDPACVVLDCRFCGACVGLWAFASIQCPLELFRLIADSSSQKASEICSSGLLSGVDAPGIQNFHKEKPHSNKEAADTCNDGFTAKEISVGLDLTIAGGPPPTKQNFRPRVSFPVISRHLRAEYCSISSAGNSIPSSSCKNQVDQCFSQKNDQLEQQKYINGSLVRPEGLESLKRKRSECEDVSVDYTNNEENHDNVTSERGEHAADFHSLDVTSSIIETSEEVHKSDIHSNGCEGEALNTEKDVNILKDGETSCTTPNVDVTIHVSGALEKMSDASDPRTDSVSGFALLQHGDSSHIASFSTTNTILCSTRSVESESGSKDSDLEKLEDAQANTQESDKLKDYMLSSVEKGNIAVHKSGEQFVQKGNVADHDFGKLDDAEANNQNDGFKDTMLSSVEKGNVAEHESGNSIELMHHCKIGGFDPIRQHRPFCPWIAPDNGNRMPGWKLTLSALIQQERDSSQSSKEEESSIVLDEVGDPILSVRKLFMSPPPKRLKGNP